MTKALIVVDVQKDFCEDGALAVEGGNAVADKIRQHINDNSGQYATIAFTKDWHKPWPDTNGGHFSEEPDYIDSWPVHCVQGTEGAEFNEALHAYENDVRVFKKGNGKPDYSGFQGFEVNNIALDPYLRLHGVTEVDIVGIAGDYCVRETALDAVRLGFKVNLLEDMIASVRGDEATEETVREVAARQLMTGNYEDGDF